jgi:Family of unknown function (DUF6328)
MTLPRRQDADSPRPESTAERVDRNLTELLSELRVALPGVQVLFAFLLVVPFNQRFGAADRLARTTYFVTLLLTAAASIFLIAPSFHHRWNFRRQRKERVVLTGSALALVGLVLLALAMTGVVLLVTEFLFGPLAGALTAAAVAGMFGAVWFGIAAAGRRGRSGSADVVPGRDEPRDL